MSQEHQEYKGHRIELRTPTAAELSVSEIEGEAEPELLIDEQPIRYGQLPDGQYFLHDYAYDWRDDLMDLARGFIDYQARASVSRRDADDLPEREVDSKEGE